VMSAVNPSRVARGTVWQQGQSNGRGVNEEGDEEEEWHARAMRQSGASITWSGTR